MTGLHVLTINGGSSSVKFAVFAHADAPAAVLNGQIERIGGQGPVMTVRRHNTGQVAQHLVEAADHRAAGRCVGDIVAAEFGASGIAAVGHRVVHGGLRLLKHQLITPQVLTELRAAQSLAPNHLPGEIALMDVFLRLFPACAHVACFDTAFHRDMPRTSQLLPIPRRFLEAGVRRFGFHGLSYEYLMDKLKSLDPQAAAGRIILAHLGSGASMAAVRNGRSMDTTMGFTPTAGLVMATRPGDMDPGALVYLMRQEHLEPDDAERLITRECGLMGVSQASGDMRDLLARRAADPRAAEAVDLYCHQAKKQLAAMAASMGGVDTLIFSGGVGEHSSPVRAMICQGLEFLGITVDPAANDADDGVISREGGRVVVRIIPTDEEVVIARTARSLALASHTN